MNCDRVGLVVSFWPGRSPEKLQKLVASAHKYNPGCGYETTLVINGPETALPLEITSFFHRIFHRENTGYNLGAWDHGWRQLKNAKYLLFVQDDCEVVSDN